MKKDKVLEKNYEVLKAIAIYMLGALAIGVILLGLVTPWLGLVLIGVVERAIGVLGVFGADVVWVLFIGATLYLNGRSLLKAYREMEESEEVQKSDKISDFDLTSVKNMVWVFTPEYNGKGSEDYMLWRSDILSWLNEILVDKEISRISNEDIYAAAMLWLEYLRVLMGEEKLETWLYSSASSCEIVSEVDLEVFGKVRNLMYTGYCDIMRIKEGMDEAKRKDYEERVAKISDTLDLLLKEKTVKVDMESRNLEEDI